MPASAMAGRTRSGSRRAAAEGGGLARGRCAPRSCRDLPYRAKRAATITLVDMIVHSRKNQQVGSQC